jgi:hypothetical protein
MEFATNIYYLSASIKSSNLSPALASTQSRSGVVCEITFSSSTHLGKRTPFLSENTEMEFRARGLVALLLFGNYLPSCVGLCIELGFMIFLMFWKCIKFPRSSAFYALVADSSRGKTASQQNGECEGDFRVLVVVHTHCITSTDKR